MFCVFELLLVLVLFTEMCLWQVSQSWLFIVEISHLGNVWREVSMCRESNLIILVLRVRLSRHLSLWAAATATLPRQKAWERIANAVANALQASLKVEILKVFYCWKSESLQVESLGKNSKCCCQLLAMGNLFPPWSSDRVTVLESDRL